MYPQRYGKQRILSPAALTEKIIALHKEGLSPSEIASELNTTRSTVYSRLTRAGLTPHPAPSPPSPLTEKIITLHNEGLSPLEIADKLGATYGIVWGRLMRAGLTPHLIPPPPPPALTEEIIALHNEGLPPLEIAARLNITYSLVYGRLIGAGLKPHRAPMYVKSAEHAQDIIKLHGEGLSGPQIAKMLGISTPLVYKRLHEERCVSHPSVQEAMSTLEGLDEITRLAKEGVPRYEIAKQTKSTWPLVAEALEEVGVKPVWPACGELTNWLSTLLPILDEIRKAHPNTEPIVTKVEQLEKELAAISDATWAVEHKLPFEGGAEEERWCLGNIRQAIKPNLIEPLKGCVRQLDVAELPRKIEQAEACISNLTNLISEDVRRVTKHSSNPSLGNPSETIRVGIGDSVCDKISGSCGPIVDITNGEVLIEPTIIKKKIGEKYLETAEPPIRVKKTNLEPNRIMRYEGAKLNPGAQIKDAAELWKNSPDGKKRRVRLALWNDGTITSCEALINDNKEIEGSCYTTEPGQEEAYRAFEAHLTSPEVGYQIKGIEVENAR